jgi:hypothetical protein
VHQHKRMFYHHLQELAEQVGLHPDLAGSVNKVPNIELDWAQQSHVLKLAVRKIKECNHATS